jgi:hypothetical protein
LKLRLALNWSRMNQSAVATVWPFSRVRFRVGVGAAGSLILLAFAEFALDGDARDDAAGIQRRSCLGNLPISSAVIDVDDRRWRYAWTSIEACSEARMPVTTTSSTCVGLVLREGRRGQGDRQDAGGRSQNGLVEISHTRLLPFFQTLGPGAEPQAQSDTNSSADIRRTRYFSGLGNGNCDGNLSDDKAKKEPIADHVLIGMKMVICYFRSQAMARFCAGVRN